MSAQTAEPRGVDTNDQLMTVLEETDKRVQALPERNRTRSAGVGLIVAGLACFLLPGTLARLVGGTIATLLDVSYETSDRTGLRLRLCGLVMVLAGGHLVYHGDIRPVQFT